MRKVFFFLFCFGLSSVALAQQKPNIVYILTDDMGYGDLSCYGQKNFQTPTLDKLAAQGIKFTQHYAGSPVCAPSRASLLTGRDPGHSRVRGNYEKSALGFGSGYPLRDEDVTLAEVVKLAGYRTALIGKWGLDMPSTSGSPDKQGFDEVYGFMNQAHAHYHFPEYLYRNGTKEPLPENRNGKRGRFSNDIFTSEALQFLGKQQKDQPSFLYLALITPHAELVVPEDSIFNHFKGKFQEKPFVKSKQGSNGQEDFGAYGSQKYPAAAYATMVVRIDLDVAKIMAQLKKMGLDQNTVIMFSSDNGSHKEGGADPAAHQSNGHLRGAKRDVYEGGIRVPFIVHWPAKIKKPAVSDHISAFWDMMPTFADLAGVDLKKQGIKTEGISLMPTLTGKASRQKKHDYLYWEFHEAKTTSQAVRMGKWKGVRHNPAGKLELYNLENDESETNNVADDNFSVVKAMEKTLSLAREPHELWPLKTGPVTTSSTPN